MENKNVYVCYVQNNLVLLQGEEVISCLMVTQNQDKIDSWLDEQLREAEENGYAPDDDVTTYKGMFDYTLTVSKGNEEDGFDSYCFVCKPYTLEE